MLWMLWWTVIITYFVNLNHKQDILHYKSVNKNNLLMNGTQQKFILSSHQIVIDMMLNPNEYN